MIRLVSIGLIALALSVSACGKKGPLDLPRGATESVQDAEQQVEPTIEAEPTTE